MASFASSATTCGARKHAWTKNLCHIILYGKTDFTVRFFTTFKLAGGQGAPKFHMRGQSGREIIQNTWHLGKVFEN